RIETDERVAPDVLPPLHALEQKRLGIIRRERGEGGHRRDGVGAQLAHHGDNVVVVTQFVDVHRLASPVSSRAAKSGRDPVQAWTKSSFWRMACASSSARPSFGAG